MGFIDEKFKDLLGGAKDFARSPAGMLALGLATPYIAGAPWLQNVGAMKGMGILQSPIVGNALKNAAMNYGIATLTGSRHPGRSALWAAAASTPFTMMKSKTMADTFNKGLSEKGKVNWFDIATGKVPAGTESMFPTGEFVDEAMDHPMQRATFDTSPYEDMFTQDPYTGWEGVEGLRQSPVMEARTLPELNYFTRPGGKDLMEKAVTGSNPAAGLMSMLGGETLGNLDVMATLVPQIAGLYGGRMSDEEKWDAWKKKRIKMLAWKYGIPEEDAERMITGEQVNPFYDTLMPEDYGDIEFYNQGGYIDDYTAGGEAVGPGTGTSDDIAPVALSNGEFVFTKDAVDNAGGPDVMYSVMNQLDPNSERPEEAREVIV